MAGNLFNPHSPTTLGEEWLLSGFGTVALSTTVFGQKITSRSAETINKITAWIDTNGGGMLIGLSDLLLYEVFPAGSELGDPTTIVMTTYHPSADQARAGWVNQASGTVNLYQAIDEGVDTYAVADYVFINTGTVSDYDIRFGSAGFSGTAAARGIRVRFVALSFGAPKPLTVQLVHSSGSVYTVAIVTPPNSATTYDFNVGELNPKTLLPWTPTDIQGFSSGTWAVRLEAAGGPTAVIVYAIDIVVISETERRVAAASASVSIATVSGPLASSAFVALPGAGASWSKPASGDFSVIMRRPVTNLVTLFNLGMLLHWQAEYGTDGQTVLPPITGLRSSLYSGNLYGQLVTKVDAYAGIAAAVLLTTTAPAVSQDSQPYYLGTSTDGTGGSEQAVNTGATVTQRFTMPSAQTVDGITLVIQARSSTTNLTLKIKRVSDNVQFGNTLTVTPATVNALADAGPCSFKRLTVAGFNAALANGTQYYVELTNADAAAVSGWLVSAPGHSSLAGGAATWNGTPDSLFVAGVQQQHRDLAFRLSTKPAAPASVTASVTTATLDDALGCRIPRMNISHVTWAATALGAAFSYYEIQRTYNGGTTSDTIGTVATEATVAFDDYEAARNRTVAYRVRVVRTDGAESDWTAWSAGHNCVSLGCEMLFVSNEAPSLAVGYNREPSLNFKFVAATRDQIHEIYGADGVVAFMESEDPGVAFAFRLTINAGITPLVAGLDAFAELRTLTRQDISYVCVLDYTGDVFYAHVQLAQGAWDEPGYQYHADVTVAEVGSSPSVAAR